MIRKKRDPYWLARFRKTYEWGRKRRIPLITGVALVRVSQMLQPCSQAPCAHAPHSWVQAHRMGARFRLPTPCSLFSPLVGVALRQMGPFTWRKRKKSPFFRRKGVRYFNFWEIGSLKIVLFLSNNLASYEITRKKYFCMSILKKCIVFQVSSWLLWCVMVLLKSVSAKFLGFEILWWHN